jgi:hypothetical protein
MPVEPTIGEYLSGILPRLRGGDTKFPWWPPDLFALCLALLKQTGAYAQLLQNWPPDQIPDDALGHWTSSVRELGAQWRTDLQLKRPFSDLNIKGLGDEWELLCKAFRQQLSTVERNRPLLRAVMKLVAVADEASEGVGAPEDADEDDFFLVSTRAFLRKDATLGLEIDHARVRVLPRMHTPQNGLTERSLSLYLSMCDAGEVTPRWLSTPFLQHDSINLLLIPWPHEVLVSQFRDVTDTATTKLPDGFGFFTYGSLASEDLIGLVESSHAEAKRKLGRIDGVVLPELSITDEQFRSLRDSLPPECFLVAGTGRVGVDGRRGTNEVRLSFPPLQEVVQKKHHPWKLNEAQIIQYGLGGILSPSREWWEYADLADRRLDFVAMSEDLVICALVCEDLARPDPVANIVRAVGPNLVIALLMDGPQTKERWAARYATVLADDPGCSVLSLTSLGMAQLSRPESGPSRPRVVALWKDAFRGATEIELPEGRNAVALSLSIRYQEEFTADGRGDDNNAAFLILSGVHPISDPRFSNKS